MIIATIITPDEYLGSIIKICEEKRGKQKDMSYSGNRVVLKYDLPLNEVKFLIFTQKLNRSLVDMQVLTMKYASIFQEI